MCLEGLADHPYQALFQLADRGVHHGPGSGSTLVGEVWRQRACAPLQCLFGKNQMLGCLCAAAQIRGQCAQSLARERRWQGGRVVNSPQRS